MSVELADLREGDELLVRVRVYAVHPGHRLVTCVPASSAGVGILVSQDDIEGRLTPPAPPQNPPASD